MLIDQIIADLVAPPEQAPPLYREELIIRLSMWMQFGAAQEEVAFAVCSCVVGYVVAHFEDAPPDQWPEYFQKFFLRALPARMLKSLFLTLIQKTLII